MSRRRSNNESSLELLLDTICNTFGGILFVAMLIVVMLRMTSKSTAAAQNDIVSEAEQIQLVNEQAQLADTVDELRRAASELDLFNAMMDERLPAALVESLKSRRERRLKLIERRLELLADIAEHQSRINAAQQEARSFEARKENVAHTQEGLESALKTERSARTEQVAFSHAHWSGKHEIQTVLRYGHLYFWHKYGPSGAQLGLNTDEFVVVKQSDSELWTTPKPQSGTPIADSQASKQALLGRFSRFNPRNDYIAVIVWPDSFIEFQVLRKVLVSSGFEYRLEPAERDSQYRDRGG